MNDSPKMPNLEIQLCEQEVEGEHLPKNMSAPKANRTRVLQDSTVAAMSSSGNHEAADDSGTHKRRRMTRNSNVVVRYGHELRMPS